jgi:hypothetical protein
MSLLWKKYTIEFSLQTKDNKQFRHVYVDFEQKRNWYWLISENVAFHKCLKDCIQEWFLIWVNLNWIYEGEDPNRLIDEKKLELVNKHIRTTWIMDWQPTLPGKIRNIELTYLIR